MLLFQACSELPPRRLDDLCAIFAQKPDWQQAAIRSYQRWGVPVPVMMAVLHQESRFRPSARPGWRRLLGLLPLPVRQSSAYGYGQVKDGTWADYRQQTGNAHARRDEFADVVDFVGWYGDVIHRLASIPKEDAYHLYLAYHEGPRGFSLGNHQEKDWLLHVTRKVEGQAQRYRSQLAHCPGTATEPDRAQARNPAGLADIESP